MSVISRPRSARERLIVALDTPEPSRAAGLAGALADEVGLLKIGLELFVAAGPAALLGMAGRVPVFLDLKFHDIPNTVSGAVRSSALLAPAMLTVHASGGTAMIGAARAAVEVAGAGHRPAVLAVTVLTSLGAGDLAGTGVAGGPTQQVLRLARLALDAGADGLVCSPREVSRLRDAFGETPLLVVPGVRPAGSPTDDQARTATPAEAVAAGADWIVLGRPITGAPDPAAAARAVLAELPS